MLQTSGNTAIRPADLSAGEEHESPKAAHPDFWRENHFHAVTSIEMFIDFITIFAMFLLAREIHLAIGVGPPGMAVAGLNGLSALLHVIASCGGMIFVFVSMGLYRKTPSLLNVDEIRRLIRSVLLLAVFIFAVSFYFRIPFSRGLITIWLGLILLSLVIEKMIFYKVYQTLHIRGMNNRRVLIYGAGEIGRKLYKNIIAFPKLGYQAIGFLDNDKNTFLEKLQRVDMTGKSNPRILGGFNDLDRVVKAQQIDELFIARKGMSSEEVVSLTTQCRQLGIPFKLIPQIFGFFLENLALQAIGGIPLIAEKVTQIRRFDLFVKRILDFTFSLCVLVFVLPVFVAIAIWIKRDSPGPVIFKQRRVGKGGEEFTIYKFRTMYVEAPKYSLCPMTSEDPRITRVGRFLRKSSLDELPQFFNVLKGQMSLVGPRPEMPFIVAQYNSLHRERLCVKPGITGLWQISADRQLLIHENIDYDLYYMEHFSILLDVAIIVRTVVHGVLSMKTS